MSLVQIIASGLTLGAMYAVSTIGLALVYGSLNMLNMAHGALLALGGYVCLYAMTALGLPPLLGVAGGHDRRAALVGLVIYHRWRPADAALAPTSRPRSSSPPSASAPSRERHPAPVRRLSR